MNNGIHTVFLSAAKLVPEPQYEAPARKARLEAAALLHADPIQLQ